MIPAGFLQELLSRVDVVDVVGRHVELKRGGANLMGLCPFHTEKSPSFSVSPAKQFYYCFGCGASGDAIRFLTEHTGMSFVDAVTELANSDDVSYERACELENIGAQILQFNQAQWHKIATAEKVAA